MTQRGVSRLLLFTLFGLAVAFVVRSCSSHEDHGNFVDFGGGWDEDRLRHDAFRLAQPVRLAVAAVGSYETDSALAAYGWIVRREDRAVVWQMTPKLASRPRGTLAVVADTITLAAGTYDAYFATFGDPLRPIEKAESVGEWMTGLLRFGNRAWESDQGKWAFRLDLVDPADAAVAERLTGSDERNTAPAGPDLLWAGGPAGRRSTGSHTITIGSGNVSVSTVKGGDRLVYTFMVTDPTALRIAATGELYRGATDYGWIDDLTTGERVWEMTEENTEWAGGSIKNRRYQGTIDLAPGLYRAAFETDGSHDADGWTANPPLDPAAWGLYLYTDTPDRVTPFDPWTQLPRVVEITGVGDDVLETATFTLDDSLRVWAHALGEMRRGDPYDYAWLIRDGNGTVWEMDYDETHHAGGEKRNRVEETSFVLPPATYTLHYASDDSHSPERWRGDPPDHPERWGVTLFALDGEAPGIEVARSSEREGYDYGPTPPRSPDGTLPIRLAPLRNDEEVARTFTLDEEATLRIYAVGEILLTDRYDYGWIIDERANDLVWEMTRSNTESAGGSRKNRQFKGTVTLPAGTYTVHFQTDDSHAFGDFSQGSPVDPSAWGIVVERADAPPPPPAPPAPPEEANTTVSEA